MKFWFSALAQSLMMLPAAALAGQQAVVAPAPIPATQLPAMQKVLDSYIADNKMPGIVVATGRGDHTWFAQAGHIADTPGAPAADPDSLWRVYSMTKPITAMAAMILIEEGKMTLDEPVSNILPAFEHMRVQNSPDTLESHPATHPITIRNLLTHTAGLGYNIITKGPLLEAYNRAGLNPAQVNVQMEVEARKTRAPNLQMFANMVARQPLIAEPGTKWSYSIGLDVMGAVIEKVSGQTFDAFVQARIFDPLQMKSSFWTVPASAANRLADEMAFPGAGSTRIPLDPGKTSVYLNPPEFPYGGAGLVMSARDYDRFLHMLQNYGELDGVRIMKRETAQLAMSNLLPAGVFFTGVAATTGGNNSAAAMGFGAGGSVYLEDKPGGAAKGTYGWGGAAGTIAFVDPVRHARGTVMVNYFPGEKYDLRGQVLPALAADLVTAR